MEKTNEQIEWLNATEAAKYLKISKHTLYGKVHRKTIPYHKNGGGLIFKKSSLDQYLNNREVLTNEQIQERIREGGINYVR